MASLLKHYDGGNVADFLNLKTLGAGLIKINGKNHYRGEVYPVVPSAGDTWEELNASGDLVGDWIYKAGWLSREIFSWNRFQDNPAAGFSGLVYNWEFPIDPRYNLFLKEAVLAVKTNFASATGLQFDWVIQRLNAPNTVTTIGTFGTSNGLIALTDTNIVVPINTVVITLGATGAKRIRVSEVRAGVINKLSAYELFYQKMRF